MSTWIYNDNGTAKFETEIGVITINQEYLENSIFGAVVSDINTDHDNYHVYGTTFDLGYTVDQVDIETVRSALAAYPTPTSGLWRSVGGHGEDSLSFAGPGIVTHHWPSANTVVNVTTDLHALDPGVVQREIVVVDGRYHIRTIGIGIGILPQKNTDYASAVWGAADAQIAQQISYHVSPDIRLEEFTQSVQPSSPVQHETETHEQGQSLDANTLLDRLDAGFDHFSEDTGSTTVDPRFEPILNRLTPEQMEGLRTELDEVRAQNRRQSDYEASMLQERMARSLQGLRESGRPDDDLDDAGILNTFGEERFADYARQRDGARRYHDAVAGMESLPDQEIEARMVALRSAKAEPGDEMAALQSDVARHVQALRAERQTDPAMAVRRIPEMKQAESELNPDDRESVSAFVGEGLRWQAVQGITPSAQRAVPRELAQTLADGILAQQADAKRDGVRPAVAMRASIDGIRNVFGDVHARSVMNSAFAEMRGADHLASMARHMFDRDEMGGMMSSVVPQMMPPVAHGQGAGGPALKPMGRG